MAGYYLILGIYRKDFSTCNLGLLCVLAVALYVMPIDNIYTVRFLPCFLFVFIIFQSFIQLKRIAQSFVNVRSYERFVPKEFLKNLHIQDIENVKLGDNVEKNMTILFSDIRNFTALSEQMNPEENFTFINSYLSVIGPVIVNHHGFIDKFIGDAIMALFDTGADDAVSGGIQMMRTLEVYNQGRKRAGYSPVGIGIGINTGALRLGTIGDHQRMDATVISDAVNVASRIEGMTKQYGVSLLISEATYKSLDDPFRYHIRKLDRVKAKGKKQWVSIYEVFDVDPPEMIKYKVELASIFAEAVTAYQAKQFKDALELFLDCQTRNPQDKPVQYYIDQCKLYMHMDLDEDWKGISRRLIYERR